MSADQNLNLDPSEEDEPPFFPVADPDAPPMPDWDGVVPEGEQQPPAGDDEPGPDDLSAHPGDIGPVS